MGRIFLFFKVKRLQKQKKIIEKKSKKLNKQGRMSPDDEIEYTQNMTMIDEKIQILTSDYLINKAEALFIPIPKKEAPYWERSISIMNNWQLSPKGMTELKEAIRKEKSYIMQWITAITGLFGAATGLVAVIKSL